MKHLVFVISFLFFALSSQAQHCEWDNSALIAVRPVYNGRFVEDLQIELISTDNPYSTKVETHKNGLYTIYKDNTKFFAKRKNIDRIKKLDYLDFIKEDYTVITSNHFNEGLFIKISDLKNNLYRSKIATQIIPVTKEHLVSLCGIRERIGKYDSLYKPIIVELSSEMMMHNYQTELPTKIILSKTFYTPPVVYKNDSVIFQIIQTGIITSETTQTVEHEFFKIYPYQFAIQHFDTLKNIIVNEQGWVLDYLPQPKQTNTTVVNNNLIKTNDTLPQRMLPQKVAEDYDQIPSLKAFIAYKLANGNEGMEKYYLTKNIEQVNSVYLYEFLDTHKELNSAKLEFDLDGDRDMDYCIVFNKPKPHIDLFVFDNVLRQFVLDTLISKASVFNFNLKDNKLVIADYSLPKMSQTNTIQTYKRWNNYWRLIEWELQDYLIPHNSINEVLLRRFNDTLTTYDPRNKQYIQHGDYNFDGKIDTRFAKDSNVVFHNTSYYCEKFDYYIYDKDKGKAIRDDFLSSGTFTFDFNKKTAIGYIEKRNYSKQKIWTSVSEKYEWTDNKFAKTEIVEQIQSCPNCERIITIRSKLIDGKWQQIDYNPGAE